MFAVKLLSNPAVFRNCYIVLNMPSVFTFHISMSLEVNELISNYILFMFKTNEPIKVIHF